MTLPRWLACLALLTAAVPAMAEAGFDFDTTPGRLPKDVVPLEYTLHIVPDLPSRTFRGTQTVLIEVRRPTSRLVMNALNLEIDSVRLTGPGAAPARLESPQVDTANQQIAFALPRRLAPGRYTLEMAWHGGINSTPEGLFVDPYPTLDGEKLLLATMMEPTDARRLLPCWDEPAFRARFRLSVDLPADQLVVSNTPIAHSAPLPGGLKRSTFGTTPKMSSYLLAFVAGDLRRLEGSADSTRIGIVTTPDKQRSAPYALAASEKLLHYYNSYFGTRYPLPKLDHIAAAGGFRGAMENWGAIVYNETTLLVDPRSSPEESRQRAFGTVAHEMAHQWFGNLVTMAWWDNLWLNEGFASWMGAKATDRFNPGWHTWLWASEGREHAMALDARDTTHPIQQPVANDNQAGDAFDEITYQKGRSFLRMLESYLGEALFRDGIRHYLAAHRYSNTTTADLWAALAQASGRPVSRIAGEWTTQPGFPLIDVASDCEAGRRLVTLRQQPFRLDRAAPPADERLWSVPIQVGSVRAPDGAFTLLSDRTGQLTRPRCDDTLLVDPHGVGYFRVRYAPPLFDALAQQLPQLPDGARFKLLADTAALVRADQLPLTAYLGLLERLGAEPRQAVWGRALSELRLFDQLLADDPARERLHHFGIRMLTPRFAALGWDEKAGESSEDRQLRGTLADALSDSGDDGIIAAGRERFVRYLADPTTLPPSLVDAVLNIVGRHADQASYDALKGLAERATASEDKFRAYRALGRALDPALAAQALQLARSPEVPQIIRNEIGAIVAESGHVEMAWDDARAHADALLADMRSDAGPHYFGHLLETATSAARADELETFARARLPESALTVAHRAADQIRTRAALKARLVPQLETALAAR